MQLRFAFALSLAALAAALLPACGGGQADPEPAALPTGDPGPVHVHGLGVNPSDEALFLATHTGMFRVAPGESRARRVGGRFQDTMGFTVTGPDRFLGSGHPDARDGLPPFLGLIRSSDAGRSWQPVSLLGRRDFHVLEAAGAHIYGYGSDFETRTASLLASDDGGRSWQERPPPEPLISLAIDPRDPQRLLASGEEALYSSSDGGRGWRPLGGEPGLLAWSESGAYLVGLDGSVARSEDAGRSWERRGAVDGRPSALESAGGALYLALHDGTILRSGDGGRGWTVRSRP
ncbi:MAG TPA: hypothetical protein VEY90_05260 [Thermoleophilaceae bacterium]|nr:hypothetical protein [Thermoleophilaceae bacterium]